MSEVDDAMLSYSVDMKEDREKRKEWEIQKPSPAEELSFGQLKREWTSRWSKASTEFDESRLLVNIVCSREAGGE